MKILFAVVFLCGVASSLALPRCSTQDLMQCTKDMEKPDVRTLEELDVYCRGMECVAEFYGRCNLTSVAENYRYMLGVLCPDDRQIREKIAENGQCFGEAKLWIEEECDFNPANKNNEEVCRMIRAKLPCAVRVVERECNKFTADIFAKVFPVSRICKDQ